MKDNIIKHCIICSKSIPRNRARWSHVKYCSDECARKAYQDKYYLPYKGLSTSTVGTINELRVCCDLLSKGYEVFRALSPHCSCDLAILKNGKLLRIEVRAGYKKKDGTIKCGTAPQKINSFKEIKADIWAIVVGEKICYEPEL